MTPKKQLSYIRKLRKCGEKYCKKESNKMNDREFDNLRHNFKYETAMHYKEQLKNPNLPPALKKFTLKQLKKYKKEGEAGKRQVSKKTFKKFDDARKKRYKCMEDNCGKILRSTTDKLFS